MARRTDRIADRARVRALRFRTCPSCAYDLATGDGERDCHYGTCPNLPEELEIHCPLCWYNFYTGEGHAECGDPPSCDFATSKAPHRVATLTHWISEQRRGPAART